MWIWYSLYCTIAFGALSLLGRWIGTQQIETITWLLYLYLFISVWVIADLLIHRKNTIIFKQKLNLKQWGIIISVGLFLAVFGTSMQNARVIAPNPGYVDAINTSSNAFFTFLTSLFFKDELTKEKLIGIIGVTIGLIILVI